MRAVLRSDLVGIALSISVLNLTAACGSSDDRVTRGSGGKRGATSGGSSGSGALSSGTAGSNAGASGHVAGQGAGGAPGNGGTSAMGGASGKLGVSGVGAAAGLGGNTPASGASGSDNGDMGVLAGAAGADGGSESGGVGGTRGTGGSFSIGLGGSSSCGSGLGASAVPGEACQFKLASSDGDAVDPQLLYVEIRNSSASSLLTQVDPGGCTGASNEWYFESAESSLVFCPNTCAAFEASPQATLSILAGCTPA